MSLDFFLLNRAHQVARLCRSTPVEIPPKKTRQKFPSALQDFYQLLEDIGALAAADTSTAGFTLTASQRAALRRFEKLIVENRFSSDPRIKAPAVAFIRAIFADGEYFSGLKPLPQYTSSFAYELLFPSWLNLLSALMLPSAATGKTKLDGRQQGVLFHVLGKLSAAAPEVEARLTGYATFMASRLDVPACELQLQRLLDLVSLQAEAVTSAIDCIDLNTRDARLFHDRLNAYLCVKHSCYEWPTASPETRLAHVRPPIRVLPLGLRSQLEALERQGDDWDGYFALASPLSRLVASDQLLTAEYMALLEEYPDRAGQLLSVLMSGTEDRPIGEEGQICAAKLIIHLLRSDRAASLSEVEAFARSMAGHLTGYSESTLRTFCQRLVDDAENRERLLASCDSPVKQTQLADALLERAARTDDDARFLNLLACHTVVSPDPQAREAKHALQALEGVVGNRSIGSKEFSDLLSDLRANASAAIGYLANPIMAVAGKSPRLAALYLTLSDITETFRSTGNVGNFSVVRARYSALTHRD